MAEGPAPADSAPPAAVERLEHMRDAADAVTGYVARGRAAFDADPAVMDAVLYQLVVLGEAAKAALQADPSLRVRFPDVPWSPMARVRDHAAHHYYKLDRDVVWDTARAPRSGRRSGRSDVPRPERRAVALRVG